MVGGGGRYQALLAGGVGSLEVGGLQGLLHTAVLLVLPAHAGEVRQHLRLQAGRGALLSGHRVCRRHSGGTLPALPALPQHQAAGPFRFDLLPGSWGFDLTEEVQ